MSEKDRKLISESFITSDWNDVSELEKQAESAEAKQIIKDRKVHLYRREELVANQL